MHQYRIVFRLAPFILAMGLVTSSHAKSDEVFDVTKLPKAVQKTVKEQVGDGKIVKMRKETVDRRIAYGVECAKGERKWQIEVAPDGKLLLRAEEMALTNLSAAVQKTIQQNAAKGRIESIADVTEDGQSYYEAAVSFNGQEKTFIIGTDGKLIDTQIPDNQARPPEAQGGEPTLKVEPKGGYKSGY
ncbi:MAG TPA: hypothetical protein VNL17_11395 [Verrucomicrobiae bacterium]|nr:hypothetical protein [Verrucomicrobiae bacterium]